MRGWILATAAALTISLTGPTPLFAQQAPQQAPTGQADNDRPGWWDWRPWMMMDDDDRGPMGRMGWWGQGGPGMMWGGGMPMHSAMMPMMMMAMMDTDGNGSISFEEVEAVHRRVFNLIDTDKNGQLSQEEIQTVIGAPFRAR